MKISLVIIIVIAAIVLWGIIALLSLFFGDNELDIHTYTNPDYETYSENYPEFAKLHPAESQKDLENCYEGWVNIFLTDTHKIYAGRKIGHTLVGAVEDANLDKISNEDTRIATVKVVFSSPA